MTNNPTIDGVSREDLDLVLTYGCSTSESNEAFDRLRALLDAPAVERQEPDYYEKIGNVIIDLLAGRTLTAIAALRTIQAWESEPRPLMVTFADHKKGLDAYLEQITTLQSTIAQLQARIAELESGRGDVIHQVRTHGSDVWEDISGESLEMCQCQPEEYEIRKLYTAPPAPVDLSFSFEHPTSKEKRTVTLTKRDVFDGMEDYFYEKLGEQICQCESVGETNVIDCNCDEYVHDFEIVNACLDATAALNGVGK